VPGELHDEIGLSAQKRRNLGHIENLRGPLDLLEPVDVGQDGNAQFLADRLQDLQPLVEPRASERSDGGPVGLVIGGFEDEGDPQLRRHVPEACGHPACELLALDDAGPGDERQGPPANPDWADGHALHAGHYT